jgi:hypothetical protein
MLGGLRNTIGDVVLVLNDWIDHHVERRGISDTFVAGIFATSTAMNVFATIVAVYGNHTFHQFYWWFRPSVVLIVVPMMVVYNLLVVYFYKIAKGWMAGLAQDEIDRRQSRARTNAVHLGRLGVGRLRG